MKREDISRALGDIDPAFVEEAADGVRPVSGRPWKTALSLVACLVLVLTAVWFGGGRVDRQEQTVPPSVAPEEGDQDMSAVPPGLVGAVPEMLEMVETTGVITDLDRGGRHITLEETDGKTWDITLPDSLDVDDLQAKNLVTIFWTKLDENNCTIDAEQVIDFTIREEGEP